MRDPNKPYSRLQRAEAEVGQLKVVLLAERRSLTPLERQLASALVTARTHVFRDWEACDQDPRKALFRRHLLKLDKALAAFKTKKKA